MHPTHTVLIVGASVRAAAFSALRAGLEPVCIDLFADEDLQLRAACHRVESAGYPGTLLDAAESIVPCPWFYTGGLENHQRLVQRLAQQRPLWGNAAPVLRLARSPEQLVKCCREAGLSAVSAWRHRDEVSPTTRVLMKPLMSAGGVGIGFADECPPTKRMVYYQEFIVGDAVAALYVSDGKVARLLGVTKQLVGLDWLHSGGFQYCGSIGPLSLTPPLHSAFERLGQAVTTGMGLRGLFGVDCISRDGVPWPVEVNPRYTASVEVLEYALGVQALGMHRREFESSTSGYQQREGLLSHHTGPIVGKAILFAQSTLTFPPDGPWRDSLNRPQPVSQLPCFADIPAVGSVITKGKPVLTMFAAASSTQACLDQLRQTAHLLDRLLWKSYNSVTCDDG